MTPNARLPAYARELADARRRGLTLRDPTVSVRLSGLRRPGIGYGVCVPLDSDPAKLSWGWARGLELIVFWAGEPRARVQAACHAIKAVHPRRLILVDVRDRRVAVIVRHDDQA